MIGAMPSAPDMALVLAIAVSSGAFVCLSLKREQHGVLDAEWIVEGLKAAAQTLATFVRGPSPSWSSGACRCSCSSLSARELRINVRPSMMTRDQATPGTLKPWSLRS